MLLSPNIPYTSFLHLCSHPRSPLNDSHALKEETPLNQLRFPQLAPTNKRKQGRTKAPGKQQPLPPNEDKQFMKAGASLAAEETFKQLKIKRVLLPRRLFWSARLDFCVLSLRHRITLAVRKPSPWEKHRGVSSDNEQLLGTAEKCIFFTHRCLVSQLSNFRTCYEKIPLAILFFFGLHFSDVTSASLDFHSEADV